MFDSQLDSLGAELIATRSKAPVRTLHRRWHSGAQASGPTDAELEAASLAQAEAEGGAEAGEYSLRALLHEAGMLRHLPKLHAMRVSYESLLRVHSWGDLERLGLRNDEMLPGPVFTRSEAFHLYAKLEKVRKRTVTQLLGSLTRQRVREGSAVRDAKVGAWQSPFERKRASLQGVVENRVGPVEARPHSRSGTEGGVLADRDLGKGGEALATAGQILALRSQLAAARDEQLQAELLEEGEHGWAPLSAMQGLGGKYKAISIKPAFRGYVSERMLVFTGPWSESRESLSRLEGRVTYSLGHTYVQAPLGEAPTADSAQQLQDSIFL